MYCYSVQSKYFESLFFSLSLYERFLVSSAQNEISNNHKSYRSSVYLRTSQKHLFNKVYLSWFWNEFWSSLNPNYEFLIEDVTF